MMDADLVNIGWFFGVIAALVLLFAAGLKLPVRLGFTRRAISAALVIAAAAIVIILANVALFRHDAHLDLTREKAFTPSAEASRVIRGLNEPVDVAYFFQKQNGGAVALDFDQRQTPYDRFGIQGAAVRLAHRNQPKEHSALADNQRRHRTRADIHQRQQNHHDQRGGDRQNQVRGRFAFVRG